MLVRNVNLRVEMRSRAEGYIFGFLEILGLKFFLVEKEIFSRA